MLVDTCIFIDVLRGSEDALRWFEETSSDLSISTVTVLELEHGARGLEETRKLEAIYGALRIVDVDLQIARQAGILLRRYRPSHGIDAIDAVVAATALLTELPLVTLNLKHFPMFPDLQRPY